MVQSTIGLAHSLGRKVVAEGVEHRDILDVLSSSSTVTSHRALLKSDAQ